ncbi:hypothetical protein C4580_06355 [Candidatus Woesearchaeota archaeon]|nr:MAG: hypothetical protein C4580_06355 [Candidatus Woesearchaeota archaeon]
MNRRGEAKSGGAVTLVALITIALVFYILLVPSAERERLLEGANASKIGERFLLDEAPGRLEFTERAVTDHDLSNLYLSETRNAEVLHQENPFTVGKGIITEQRKIFSFSVPDLRRTENIILGFQAIERNGDLLILLNGQPIFSGPIPIQNPPPIVLPIDLLRSSNTLEFAVTGGVLERKKMSFSDIKIIGEVTQPEKQRALSTFTISRDEKEHLDTAFLDFYPICEQDAVGVLTITLNNRIIFAATPSCDSLNRQDLFKDDFKEGRNELEFTINRGSYRVEQLRVRTILEEVDSWIDYFTIKSDAYDDILDENRDVILRIDFVDDGNRKQARINVNGRYDAIDQTDPDFEKDITSLIKEGNNYLEILPLSELNIARITVEVE